MRTIRRAIPGRPARRHPAGSERGAAAVELVGMLPMAFIFALLVFQVSAFIWVITSANEAVRQGARAQSLGESGCGAARDTLSDSVRIVSCTSTGGPRAFTPSTVTISVKIPVIAFIEDFVPDPTITRTAYLP